MHQILIAVEQAAARRQLSETLRNYFGSGCTVHEADTGRAAVELFLRHNPHAVILDIQLPDITGLEAGRQIRRSGISTALLFLTDASSHDQARAVISLGALDYFLKPFSDRELLQSLEQAMRLYETICADPDQLRICPPVQESEEMLPESRLSTIRDNIERYIREQYTSELSMQDVARAMNYSDAYFCKLFKQCFHVNFSTWLNEFRVEKAKEMLLDSRLSIREISLVCGYSDANYFSRVFKRITGKTPSEYRMT